MTAFLQYCERSLSQNNTAKAFLDVQTSDTVQGNKCCFIKLPSFSDKLLYCNR